MNYLGHTHVALVSGAGETAEAVYVLGAVLPDLASMAGVRLDRTGLQDGPLRRGLGCHVATDAAFHAHPAFTRGSADIRRQLTEVGLARGSARAVAHVGWEFLLDGTLVATDTEDAFWRALDRAEVAGDIIREGDRKRWADFLTHRTMRPRLRYDEPAWVGDRVWTTLSRRPRLRFSRRDLPAVVETLAQHRPRVVAAAREVLDELVP